MTNEFDPPGSDDQSGASPEGKPTSHEVRHSQASALVPESVATGVYSTGTMVFQGAHEFVVDFVMRLGKPHQLVARLILAPSVIPSILRALDTNLVAFEKQFHPESESSKLASSSDGKNEGEKSQGAEAVGRSLPGEGQSGPGSSHSVVNPNPDAKVEPEGAQPIPSHIEDLYSEIKIAPEVMSGTYANAVLIGHSANEISFDFITTFYPRSSVASRVHMAIPTAKRFLDSLKQAHQQHLQRQQRPPAGENPTGNPQQD